MEKDIFHMIGKEKIRPGSLYAKYMKEYEEVIAESMSSETDLIFDPRLWCTFKFLDDLGGYSPADDEFYQICDDLEKKLEYEMLMAIMYTVNLILKNSGDEYDDLSDLFGEELNLA